MPAAETAGGGPRQFGASVMFRGPLSTLAKRTAGVNRDSKATRFSSSAGVCMDGENSGQRSGSRSSANAYVPVRTDAARAVIALTPAIWTKCLTQCPDSPWSQTRISQDASFSR